MKYYIYDDDLKQRNRVIVDGDEGTVHLMQTMDLAKRLELN